ncbi:hypothetical protein D9M70_595130 [compost metagenome]
MQFKQVASAVRQRLCTSQNICRGHHSGLNPLLPKSIFHEPVKVGRDDYADVTGANQLRYRVMCLGRDFSALFAVLLVWLDIPVQYRPPLVWRIRDFFQQGRIVRFLARLLTIPSCPIGLVLDALGGCDATNQIQRDFPACRNFCRA